MAYRSLKTVIEDQLQEIRSASLYKTERELLGPQGGRIRVAAGEVINLCANNYLGLANHPEIINAAVQGLQDYGYGMASVRFICGTQAQHTRLEQAISQFLGTEAPFSIRPVSMPIPVCLKHSLMNGTPSSAMPSTTPVLSMAFASAKRNGSATPIPT